MGSSKGKKPVQGLGWREKARSRQRRTTMELLENRRLLTGNTTVLNPTPAQIAQIENGPLAKAGEVLWFVYQDYTVNHFSTAQLQSKYPELYFQGSSVAIAARGSGNFANYVSALVADGDQINIANPSTSMMQQGNEIYVTGYVPIANLPAIAQMSQTIGLSPAYSPIANTTGSANNEADQAMSGAAARAANNGLTGAGVTVGVISTSVNRFTDTYGPAVGMTGIAASVKTGDIPSASRVNVLDDAPANASNPEADSDEGRAMIENIFDIAPGVNTAFYTGFDPNQPGDAGFAQAITSLVKTGGASIVVDDLSTIDDPMFQTGIIGNTIAQLQASNGISYFSSASNSDGNNGGYASPWRGTSASVNGIGSGTFFNFSPSGAASTGLSVTTDGSSPFVALQWDQPWYTTNGVTSSLNLYVLDSSGNVVTSSVTNAVQAQQPFQFVQLPATAGTYTIVVQLASGAAPGHIEFAQFGGDSVGGFVVSHANGSAGGVTYPSSWGHADQPGVGGVGAVPWWMTTAWQPGVTPVTEPFSSAGPSLLVYNFNGTPLATPQVVNGPVVSGADGGSTSFFPVNPDGSAAVVDTSNPGNVDPSAPSSPTNLNPQPTLSNFFGTSSAAPNVAAVAALMKQLKPSATYTQILAALESSATPVNGQAAGTWNTTAGYGLVNATKALAAISGLAVVSSIPTQGQTMFSGLTFVQLTFNKPIVLSTLNTSNLALADLSNPGVGFTIGTPIGVDNPTTPTVVYVPITVNRNGMNANGNYALAAARVQGVDGSTLQQFYETFSVADFVPPKITSTSFVGRTVKITFSEPIDPSTVNLNNFLLVRANNPTGTLGTASQVIVSNDPRVALSYNPQTFTVTMDLSALPQTLMPSDTYQLIAFSPQYNAAGQQVTTGVTDLVGNALDGEYNGVSFPTGNGVAGGNFSEVLPETLTGPIFNYVQLAPSSDSGIQGDSNTNVTQPTIIGQIGANFPGTAAGVLILAEFYNGLHNETTPDLGVGAGGRGFVGTYDAYAITNAAGQFSITAPANLPNGLNDVELVAIGQADQTLLPALSSATATSFRIDTTYPTLDTTGTHTNGSTIPSGAQLSTLSSLTLFFTDPVAPAALGSPLSVPTLLGVPALNPTTADNINNYKLLLTEPNGLVVDESSFIATATFTSTTHRVYPSDPYTGTVTLSFSTGLPSGKYDFVATDAITDAAGNPLAGSLGVAAPNNYDLKFTLQQSPVYITDLKAVSVVNNTITQSNPRAYFEAPPAVGEGNSDGTATPPTEFILNVSNPLAPINGSFSYLAKDIWLAASADTAGGTPDGNFGTLGTSDDGTGYSIVPWGSVTVQSIGGAQNAGQPGFDEQVILTLPAGYTLPADYYRLYLPNNVNPTTGVDYRIHDIYGNQLDGEFLGDETASGTYEDLLPNGQYRYGLSGDGTAGGGFATGYVVVPNGNVIFANPSYSSYSPFGGAGYPDGSPQHPFPVLAPEAVPNSINGGNLNSPQNFGPNFNPSYDKSGDGQFEPSALYAAQVDSAKGPVVVVAEPGTIFTNPTTGATTQATFVLQAPASGSGGVNDGSTSIPAMTSLVMQPGSTLKMENASLFVQNQGSALEVNGGGGANQQVTFTSFADDSVGGDTNHDASNTSPQPGDWGGIVFRNFDQQGRTSLFPGQIPTAGVPSQDNRLKNASGGDAVSGADDLLSTLNFAVLKYGGGSVPQGVGTSYSSITLIGSRPTITNSIVSLAGSNGSGGGGANSSFAGVSADVDSLREDNLAAGPLMRRLTFSANNLNGIYIQAEPNGVAEPTDSMSYPVNPSNEGGAQNYVLDDPYPYLLTTPMVVGSVYEEETSGQQTQEPDRLYVQPGMMVKLETGTGIEVQSIGAAGRQPSINVGVRTYINEWDNNPAISSVLANGSLNPNFVFNSTNNATALFTSFYDDKATTTYTDPNTQITTTIVAPLPINGTGTNNPFQPTPTNVPAQARWGGIQIDSPAVGVINNATIQYAGGTVNIPTGTTTRHALQLAGAAAFGNGSGTGMHTVVTDDNFYYNTDAPMQITPNGLLSANPDEPLTSGEPFFHSNVMVGNGVNGLSVTGDNGIRENAVEGVNSVWPGTDLTYIVRDTITLAGSVLAPPNNPSTPGNEPKSPVTLTIQSTLPGTILADGSVVPNPGVSAIVKFSGSAPNSSTGNTTTPTAGSEVNEGAGFVSGMDNGVDPTADPLIDVGVASEMRFLGIGSNQATGQTRVPVVFTSIHDDTYGTTVRGVTMNTAITGDNAAPTAGDGGNIIFGSHTMTAYNLFDPRQGNLIDNVDMKYMSRIEQIGGGIIEAYSTNPTSYAPPSDPLNPLLSGQIGTLLGQPMSLPDPLTGQPSTNYADEYNGPNALTVSNSNISSFRDFGFWAHPGFQPIVIPENYTGTVAREGEPFAQEPTLSFLVNDTFSNITKNSAVEIDGNNIPITSGNIVPVATEAVLLNNSFYNNQVGVDLNNPTEPNTNEGTPIPGQLSGSYGKPGDLGAPNLTSDASVLMMNNIFDQQTTAAIQLQNGVAGSQGQYNLFNANGTDVLNNGASYWGGNNQPVIGDPLFVNAAAGNFNLQEYVILPNGQKQYSAAINAGRSELGPDIFGDMLAPAANQVLNATGGILNFTGRINSYGQDQPNFVLPSDYVFLPGSTLPNYATSWVPVLPTASYAVPGPATSAGTWDYAPLPTVAAASNGTIVVPGNPTTGSGGGVRDQNGVERNIDPNVPITGTGTYPYYDIGAFEFIRYFPPEVTGVSSTYLDPTSATGSTTKSIYAVGSVAGTNVAPQSIQVTFNHQIFPTSISSSTVELEESTNGTFLPDSTTTLINLAGKLSFNSTTDTLTINLGAAGLTLTNGEYRLILVGTGSSVLKDPQGNALDGENIDSTGNQTSLPSGNGIPGGNFQVTFTIDTHPPALVPGSFTLSTSSYSNPDYIGSGVTNQNQPTFQGSITDIFPPANPVAGDTVFIDISTTGNGVFNLLNAGVGTTDVNGNFSIKLSTPLPSTNYTVGPDGLLVANGTIDPEVSGDFLARVRVVDQSGNVSNTVTGTLGSFASQGALDGFIVDTTPPVVLGIMPAAGTVATVTNGVIPVSVVVNKNIDPKTLTASSIQVIRSGGSGTFGAGSITMAIDPTSIKVTPLKTGQLGAELITFNIIGSAGAPIANDNYQITLKGTGANPIEDIAGNPLGGGKDFVSTTLVYQPSLAHIIYVGPASDITNATNTQGSFENPFPTITAGLATAKIGDIVAVLPGVYTESVTLKSLVTLESASLLSSDATVAAGDPLQTIIRAPAAGGVSTTVVGSNLVSAAGFYSVLSGFTIASPLFGNPASGSIGTNTVGLSLSNSNIIVSNDYFIDSAVGVEANGPTMPTLVNDVVAGNVIGMGVTAVSGGTPLLIENSDFVYNSYGLAVTTSSALPTVGTVANSIFWQNHTTDGTTGWAIGVSTPDRLNVFGDMFADNGPNLSNPGDDTYNVASPGGFNPAALTTTKPDPLGNFVGEPNFMSPRDPRPAPGGDGPATFFLEANFDLSSNSAAIDKAIAAYAPATDMLYRGRVSENKAWSSAAFGASGPADVGAFEFGGTGGITSGASAFHVTSATLLSGTISQAAPSSITQYSSSGVYSGTTPTALVVKFSSPVNQATLKATDLVITGSGNSNVKATNLTWIDSETVEFSLVGGYNVSGGTILLSLAPGKAKNAAGAGLAGFKDTVTLTTGNPTSPPVTVPTSPPIIGPTSPPPSTGTGGSGNGSPTGAEGGY